MNLESQVCSLELSKKLKSLGVKQDSYFDWYDNDTGFVYLRDRQWLPERTGDVPISAFTVFELGEIIPQKIEYEGSEIIYASIKTISNEWQSTYYHEEGESLLLFTDKNESNSRAQMLIYLLENNLMELK
jgi:hypothetical protein